MKAVKCIITEINSVSNKIDYKMLRLDKFIEASASLPSQLRDELTTIRELDLVVQNSMDKQEREVYIFFQNALTLNSETRDIVFQSLMSDFGKILEVADEKVNIAERLQNVLSERLEQLDREIDAFKIELETENPGVTQIIQERVSQNDYLAKNRIVNGKLRRVKKFKLTTKKRTTSTSTLRLCGMSEINKPIQPEIVSDSSKVNNTELAVTPSIESTITTEDLSIYCICHREAFGDMIACDNELCPYEWFHYGCVNMTMAPEGKWYCPKCIVCEVSLERNN